MANYRITNAIMVLEAIQNKTLEIKAARMSRMSERDMLPLLLELENLHGCLSPDELLTILNNVRLSA